MAKKGEFDQASTAFLKRECDGILRKRNLPPKLGEQGPFIIPCHIKGSEMLTTLVDSRSTFGIAENLIVKVGEMEFSADFVIVDIKEDSVVPLILGRPFLETAGFLFDLRVRNLTLRDWGKSISF
ncbi:uncharacterized protein [Rutidosis leptorrhynchoides]|uniref:uncharacterized protein n=1 Tax=Rutidosis leptorrhynchoides TaxID=125765 RepID=UPI003A98DD14